MTADGVPDEGPDDRPDEGPDEGPDEVVLAPPRRLTALAAGAALLAAGALGLADSGGRLLLLPVLLAAVGLVARDLVGGPVLRADAHGLEVLSGWRRVGTQWPGVEELRVVKDRRARVLLVDVGTAVVALSGTRLGRHPEDVLQDLQQLRARGTG